MIENTITNTTDFGAAFLAGTGSKPEVIELKGHPFLYNPLTDSLHDLEKFLPKPLRKATDRKFVSQEDFCEYVKRFKSAESSIYVSGTPESGFSIAAVLDHRSLTEVVWGDHTATFGLQRSEALKRWLEFNKKKLSQVDFADLLEERAMDIADPVAAEILEIAQSLHVTRNLSVKSLVRGGRTENAISYNVTEALKSGQDGNVSLPTSFTIELEPFARHDVKVRIKALLRPRVADERPVFVYELQLVDESVEEALEVITKAIHTQTSLPVYR